MKNINKAYGVVIYVGKQTKVMMNAKKPPVKVSRIMRLMNYFLYSIFALQILMIIILSTISVTWRNKNKTKYYTTTSESLTVNVNFGTWII